jgi:hypothetical protein
MLAVILIGLMLGAAGYFEGRAFQTYTVDYRRLLPQDYPTVALYTKINEEFRTYDEVQLVLTGDIARLDVIRVLLKDIPEALAASALCAHGDEHRSLLRRCAGGQSPAGRGLYGALFGRPRWGLSVAARRSVSKRLSAPAGQKPMCSPSIRQEKAVVRVGTTRFSDQAGVRRVVRDITERLAPVIAKLSAMGITAQLTGVPFVEELGLDALHRSLTQSLVISFGLCFVVLAVALRSAVWGLIGLFPMILVTGLLLGTVSFLKLELNAATAIVAAISIGLGVDYAIHLIQRFREERDLSVAVSRTGEALFAAFFTTASAFFVLMLSTITWNRDFGLLVGLAVFYAFVVTIFVFPALLWQ